MTNTKVFLIKLFAAVLAASGLYAQETADKSHASDYADKKASVNILENGALVGVTLDSVTDDGLVFNYDRGGQFTTPKNGGDVKFRVKDDESIKYGKQAYAKGNWEDAVVNLRPSVYPLLPLAVIPESSSDIQYVVAMFLNSLVKSGKINEALAVAKKVTSDSMCDPLYNALMSTLDSLANAGRISDAFALLDKTTIDVRDVDKVSRLLETLATLRKNGGEKNALTWYTKLNNAEGNVKKKVSTLWMIYCDLLQGNTVSASIYLSQLEDTKISEEEFSLLKLLQGMSSWFEAEKLFPKIAEARSAKEEVAAEKAYKEKISAALDKFAEGIVFGRLNSEWMPELLYKTGMAYKKMGNFKASNEIFNQIITLYPEDSFVPKSKPEIVKIEAPKATKKANADDEEDEDDGEA